MKLTTKKNAITFAIVSAIALVIGILLTKVVTIPATVIITLAIPTLVFSLCNLVTVIRAEKEYEEYDEDVTVSEKKYNWRDTVIVVTLIGVIVIIILLILCKGCSGKKEQVIEKQTVINQEVINSSMKDVDVENANVINETVQNADIGTANIGNAAIDNADIGTANIGNAAIDKADIGTANIGNAAIDKADIGTANIGNAAIDKADIGTANIDNATVGNTNCNSKPVKPVETPKVETPKTETPKTETPKVETPKTETPKTETPKTETPKVETPKSEPAAHVCAVAKTDVVNATCTEDGYTREVCSCGKVISEKPIKATGHNWDDGKVTKEATENATGTKTYTCKTCKETKTEDIQKLTHVCKVHHVEEEEATCTENGYTREICSCGKVLSKDTIKATGHKWNKGKVTKEATEKTTGKKTYTCKVCGETKTETIDKLEHECEVCDVIENEATCTKAGYIRKVCSCGEIISEKTIKATGHDYEIASEKEPTATVDGYTKYRCSNCGDTYKDVILATGEVEEPVEDEFVITVSKMKVVGNEFDAIEVYTSGNANDLVVLQNQKVFNYTIKDSHHLILTVGDVDTFAKVRIYDPAHEDKVVEVRRLSPVDPMA